MGFHLGGAPGKFDIRLDAVFLKPALGHADNLGGDQFAFEVLDGFNPGFFRHSQYPAGGPAGGFAEEKFANLLNLGIVFLNPIEARDAAIEITTLHIDAHFLRADGADLEVRVIHVWQVRAAADAHVPAGLGQLFNRGILQAALRQTKTELFLLFAHPEMFCARETKKHSRPITRAGWFATVRAEKRIFFSFFLADQDTRRTVRRPLISTSPRAMAAMDAG